MREWCRRSHLLFPNLDTSCLMHNAYDCQPNATQGHCNEECCLCCPQQAGRLSCRLQLLLALQVHTHVVAVMVCGVYILLHLISFAASLFSRCMLFGKTLLSVPSPLLPNCYVVQHLPAPLLLAGFSQQYFKVIRPNLLERPEHASCLCSKGIP